MTAPTENSDAAKVVDLLRSASIAMITSLGDSGLQAHPMGIQQVDDDGDLWFFLPASSQQASNIAADARVNVAVSTGDAWVSVSGRGELVKDRDRIEELWDDMVGAYFEQGKDDPEVTLLHVNSRTAEYWDTPGGKITAFASYLKARVTGDRVSGENAETTLP